MYHSPALPVVMTCVAAWLQAALTADDGGQRMVLVDESWRMFSHLPIAAWMQRSFKLSRASGTMNVLVMHRLSDLVSAGWPVSTRSDWPKVSVLTRRPG